MTELARNALAAARIRAGECARKMHAANDAMAMVDSAPAEEYLEDQVHAFKEALDRLHSTIVFIYETLGMAESLQAYRSRYAALDTDTARILHFDGEHELPYSPSLEFLQGEVSLVAPLIHQPAQFSVERNIVATMLKQAHLIVKDKPPTKESELREAVYRVMRLAFPDCIKDPPTPKQTNVFKPDLGMESIKTAVEIKFVNSVEDAKTVMGELYEDMKGYAGAPEWSAFQALVYQTGAYTSQEMVNAELGKVEAPPNWQVHVVYGAGAWVPP